MVRESEQAEPVTSAPGADEPLKAAQERLEAGPGAAAPTAVEVTEAVVLQVVSVELADARPAGVESSEAVLEAVPVEPAAEDEGVARRAHAAADVEALLIPVEESELQKAAQATYQLVAIEPVVREPAEGQPPGRLEPV